MGFRDDHGALKARADALQRELEDVRRQRDALEGAADEKEEARVRELEEALGGPGRQQKGRERGPVKGPPRPRRRSFVERLPVPALIVGVTVVVVAILLFPLFHALVEDWPFSPESSATLQRGGAPTNGAMDLQRTPEPAPVEATALAEIDASDLQLDCNGYVPRSPHVLIRTTEQTQVILDVTSSANLVMLALASDGTIHCDDNGGDDLNPRLDLNLLPGEHRVWVGPFSRRESHPFSLEVRARGTE